MRSNNYNNRNNYTYKKRKKQLSNNSLKSKLYAIFFMKTDILLIASAI